ncbi:hypothetical protein [Speluncibacter jeojiensis]|uniref:Low molecular weight antigen MTB12-like C-terminal domain-containing protein n=1 Tax=Speluncibacter jeojiensis TaxID=2710754 RepID=A0A9X4M0W2_9ACTN|nr:hypothetical protein [Corynebacteriales bacterium D3-21]
MRTRPVTALMGLAVTAAALTACGSNTTQDHAQAAATTTQAAPLTTAAAHTSPTTAPAPTTHAPVVNAPVVPPAANQPPAPAPAAEAATPAPAPAQAPAAAPVAPAASTPSIADLNSLVSTALDPNVPAAQKESLVQGGQQDPSLFTQLGALRAQYPTATATVVGPVVPNPDGSVTATTQVGFSGQSRDVQLTFVDDGGSWKLSRTNACHFIALAGRSSPMCA